MLLQRSNIWFRSSTRTSPAHSGPVAHACAPQELKSGVAALLQAGDDWRWGLVLVVGPFWISFPECLPQYSRGDIQNKIRYVHLWKLHLELMFGFITMCILLRAYSSFPIILCNHLRFCFTIIWGNISKLSLLKNRNGTCCTVLHMPGINFASGTNCRSTLFLFGSLW